MRIFSSKTYIVWPKFFDGSNLPAPVILNGQQLRDKIRLGTMQDGDTIYETSEFARVKEKRSVELVDPAGAVVETAEDIVPTSGDCGVETL